MINLNSLKSAAHFAVIFFKWLCISVITGVISGLVGAAFHVSIEYVTHFRGENPYILYFLPLGGIIIIFLYKLCKVSHKLGTNDVINSVRTYKPVSGAMAPLIFVSTVITHLCGGSAGREGAALQLGGSIGSAVGRLFRLKEKEVPLIVMCGMSGVFAALFGTPITAAFFAIEVISVGIMYFSGLAPCLFSAVTAYGIAMLLGVKPVRFALSFIPKLTPLIVVKIVGIGAVCAVISILFCMALRGAERFYSKFFKNLYLRAAAGGIIIILLTLISGTYDYNGAGMNIVEQALKGSAVPEAFIMKIVFTAITIGAGFKGGEIVPAFFVGSTLGCVLGGFFEIDPSFCAALGLTAIFCGVVNCPVASLILSVELFGAEGIVFFAIIVGISYMLSGYSGLYSSQKIVYSKLKAEYINLNVK